MQDLNIFASKQSAFELNARADDDCPHGVLLLQTIHTGSVLECQESTADRGMITHVSLMCLNHKRRFCSRVDCLDARLTLS